MVMIMGTSTCHMVLSPDEQAVPGMCGYVEDGILPGFFGYEAGQSAVGDHFGWFVEHATPEAYQREARERGIDIHALLQEKAGRAAAVGESGLLALDWWNGNRSVLVDADGQRPADRGDAGDRRPRRSTARSSRRPPTGRASIIETFEANGVPIHEIVAGRRARREEPTDHADLRRRHGPDVPDQRLGPDARPRLGHVRSGRGRPGRRRPRHDRGGVARDGPPCEDDVYVPNPANQATYDVLYREYVRLHDYFGRGENDVMRTLRDACARAARHGTTRGLT